MRISVWNALWFYLGIPSDGLSSKRWDQNILAWELLLEIDPSGFLIEFRKEIPPDPHIDISESSLPNIYKSYKTLKLFMLYFWLHFPLCFFSYCVFKMVLLWLMLSFLYSMNPSPSKKFFSFNSCLSI